MKRIFSNVCSFFIVLIISQSCNLSSQFQVVNQDYQNKRHFSANLLVMPLNNDFLDAEIKRQLVGNQPYNARYVSQNERTYFYNYMGPALSEKTTAQVMGIDPLYQADSINFAYRTISSTEEHRLSMFVPIKGKLKFRDRIPDYVLFFEDLYFDKAYSESSNGLGQGSSEKYSMEVGLEYLLWDNVHQKIAAYGRFQKDLRLLTIPPGKEVYIAIFEEFAGKIVEKSPLVAKSGRF